MLIDDADLAIIDAAAEPNRTAFMVAAAKEVAARVQRARDDAEVARMCAEQAEDDGRLAAEFAATLADGL